MSQNTKNILEIAVDRNNEKWVFVAREMLATLHDSLAKSSWFRRPQFRFFVISHWWQIRFFLETDKDQKDFLESQLYAHYPDIEICESALPFDERQEFLVQHARLKEIWEDTIKLYVNLDDRTEKEVIDPLSSITSALSKTPKNETAFFRVDFAPLADTSWRKGIAKNIFSSSQIPASFKKIILAQLWWMQIILVPIAFFGRIIWFLFGKNDAAWENQGEKEEESIKFDTFWYSTQVTVASTARSTQEVEKLSSSLHIFSHPKGNRFVTKSPKKSPYAHTLKSYSSFCCVLSTTELAGLVHMPTMYIKTPGINWIMTRRFEPPHNLPPAQTPNTPIGISNFRGSSIEFGLQPVDRARHTYIVGKTGMGKSTLLENMIYNDILSGRGVGLIDPHGDLADTILASIPKSRTNDIVLFDPSDTEFPIGFNMLESPNPALTPIVASGLVSIFKKMFADSWGPRLEYILRNTVLTLLQVQDTTLISIPLILTNESYRKRIVGKLKDPMMKQFWAQEFAKMAPNMQSEAVNPILNKVGQFLSSPILRNILGQPKNPFSMRWVMDKEKIFIVNLSKGKIGEDASALLGAMMVTKFQIEAMTRADTPEHERKDFGLYVDEFQNFATDSFAEILSEARKYKLSLTMANQYIAQMPETVRDAVFGNVGSMISFQVGQADATVLSDAFGGEEIILPKDFTNLRKYDIYTKLLIDGMPSAVFSATTFSPIRDRIDFPDQQSYDVILKVSRQKYTKPKKVVEKKIFDTVKKIQEDEVKHKKHQEEYKQKMKEKRMAEHKKRMEESKKN